VIVIFRIFADENCVKYRHGYSIKAPCGACGLSRKLATMTRKFIFKNIILGNFLVFLLNFCSPQKGA
jgi:hypothetical protein